MATSQWMRLALLRAESVRGRTSPNPPVGAVIVRDSVMVGSGATQPPGGPHAEIEALGQAGPLARGATLYTTLEPCCHHGRTPPCTDAILDAGVSRVVAACEDANPLVRGQGLRRLGLAGITVQVGDGDDIAKRQLAPFFSWITNNRPYVTAKWAMTLDGKLATRSGDSRWISGEESRAWVHNLRDTVDAILVGSGTVLADDPRLTVRRQYGDGYPERTERSKGPLRVLLDGRTRVPPSVHLLSPDAMYSTLLVTSVQDHTRETINASGVERMTLPPDPGGHGVDLHLLLRSLAERGITNLLVEGGAAVFGGLFDAGLIDHVAAFVAPIVAGGSNALSPVAGNGVDKMVGARRLTAVSRRFFDDDVLIEGEVTDVKLSQSGMASPRLTEGD